jgi:hypothetical protein
MGVVRHGGDHLQRWVSPVALRATTAVENHTRRDGPRVREASVSVG